MKIYREHLIEMNRAFAEDDLELDEEDEERQNEDGLFEQTLNGKQYHYSNLEQEF